MSSLASGLYERSFVQARCTAYAVIGTMLTLSMVAPIHYACGGSGNACIGCGFRIALSHLTRLDLPAAVASNVLVVPALLIAAIAVADLAAIIVRRT